MNPNSGHQQQAEVSWQAEGEHRERADDIGSDAAGQDDNSLDPALEAQVESASVGRTSHDHLTTERLLADEQTCLERNTAMATMRSRWPDGIGEGGQPPGRNTMDFEIEIELSEWEQAARLLPLLLDDERSSIGQLRLLADGTQRMWLATDSFRAAIIGGGGQGAVVDVGISPSLVNFAPVSAGDGDTTLLHVQEADGHVETRLSGPGGTIAVESPDRSYPPLESFLFGDLEIGARARTTPRALGRLVQSRVARVTVADGDDEAIGRPAYWVDIDGQSIKTMVDWEGVGAVRYELRAIEAEGSCALQVNPSFLESLLRLFDADEEIELVLPRYVGLPLRLIGDGIRAALMPIRSPAVLLRDQVEATIEEVAGHLAKIADHDGDYPLQRHGATVYGRLVLDASPPVLQVFAVLLDGVEATPELALELNDLNAAVGFARVFHVEGQVLAEVDLHAQTLDAAELSTAIERITSVAQDITPMLATVFGGQQYEDPQQRRWRDYRTAVLEAEVTPDRSADLNGPAAVADWPFPTEVHVITGWNPQGISLGEESQNAINVQIAADILRNGGRFVHGYGSSPDREHREPSIVAWGIDRTTAVTIGQKASQDAIFEVDALEVRIVSCIDGRVESWARIEGVVPPG